MSDAFQLIEADEAILIKNIMLVLYGEPGVYKTSLSHTAESPLCFDFDEGVHRSVGRKLVVKFKDWDGVLAFMASGKIQEKGVKTLVMDTGGVMLDELITDWAKKENSQNKKKGGGISQQGFGAVKDEYGRFQRECRQMGVDIVILCHSTDQSDGDIIRKRPKMTGGSYDIMKQKADLIGFMEIVNGESILTFSTTDRNIGKNAPGFPPFKLPHYTHPIFKNCLADIIQKTKDHLNSMSEEQREAVQKIENINLQISDAKDLFGMEGIEADIATLSQPLQIQLIKSYNEKFASLWVQEFVMDKDTVDEFNDLITLANNLTKEIQRLAKNKMVEVAATKGLIVNTKVKKFEKDPNFVAPPKEKEEKPAVIEGDGQPKHQNVQA